MRYGFPLQLLRFLFALYTAPRHFVIGRGVVRTAVPTRSTVAGCSFADIMMCLVMLWVNEQVAAASDAMIAVVADDFQILCVGKRGPACKSFIAADRAATLAFAAAHLPVAAK